MADAVAAAGSEAVEEGHEVAVAGHSAAAEARGAADFPEAAEAAVAADSVDEAADRKKSSALYFSRKSVVQWFHESAS